MKLWAVILKEWQLLWRDKASLLILFVMPVCLVLVLTLLQTADPTSSSMRLPVAFTSQASPQMTTAVQEGLSKMALLEVSKISGNDDAAVIAAKNAVIAGKYQALIDLKHNGTPHILLWLDPTIPQSIATTLELSLRLMLQQFQLHAVLGPKALQIPEVKVTTQYAFNSSEPLLKPNDVQQIVPAWTLFGMFLIIIPLGSIIVKERDGGILPRLYVIPVPRIYFLLGRVIAFSCVNMLQWAFMFALGIWLMPFFHLPPLAVSGHLGLLTITALCISLSATGFGLLVGTWSRTFEQAAAIGPILIMIAAAVGGIMAPVYLMPPSLRMFTQYSPLSWGQHAFLQIFVRQADFVALIPDWSKMIIFFIVAIALAMLRPMLTEKLGWMARH